MKEIKLTRGHVALVDDEDFERLNQWKWHVADGYACRCRRAGSKLIRVKMEHEVLGVKTLVDHRDRNRTNNTKRNLRFCSQSQNAVNWSRKNQWGRGVNRTPRGGHYAATISIMLGKQVRLGTYKTARQARLAYDYYARLWHEEFAVLNYPTIERAEPPSPIPTLKKYHTKRGGGKWSGLRGVYVNNYGRIFAQIKFGRRAVYLGVHDEAEEAARVYDAKAKELFGEFAILNFPGESGK